jgi:hypothetical protein
MAKKKTVWTYHLTRNYTIREKSISNMTQLYQTGVYIIINGESGMQYNMTPKNLQKIDKDLIKAEEKGEITNLIFGRKISVIEDENNLFKELEE